MTDISSDAWLDRFRLAKKMRFWRVVAFLALAAWLLSLSSPEKKIHGAHIARIAIEDIIFEDHARDEIIRELAEDQQVKAVLVTINSPGGTVVGGETLYLAIRHVGKTKPVVALLGTVAASGGYMAALGAERIFARQGTLTGSIGVLMQSAEITDLAKKLGVGIISFKSSELKGAPSPFEKVTPAVSKAISDTIADTYQLFLGMVIERRGFSAEQAEIVADGHVYTGRQALQNKLIDAIGGEEEAKIWLQEKYKIPHDISVKDVSLKAEKLPWQAWETLLPFDWWKQRAKAANSGLLVLWQQ
jgi:protease-4